MKAIDHSARANAIAATALARDASTNNAVTDSIHSRQILAEEVKDRIMSHTELAAPRYLAQAIDALATYASNRDTAQQVLNDIYAMASGRKLDHVLYDLVETARATLNDQVVSYSDNKLIEMERAARDPNTCRKVIKHLNNISRTMGNAMPKELVRIRCLAISIANSAKRSAAAATATFR